MTLQITITNNATEDHALEVTEVDVVFRAGSETEIDSEVDVGKKTLEPGESGTFTLWDTHQLRLSEVAAVAPSVCLEPDRLAPPEPQPAGPDDRQTAAQVDEL